MRKQARRLWFGDWSRDQESPVPHPAAADESDTVVISPDGEGDDVQSGPGRGVGIAIAVALLFLLGFALSSSGDDKWLAEAKRFAAQGAENPFLDVWFDDARNGIVVGAFGLALRTGDGGATWAPLMHAIDNPKALHLYAVRRIGGELFIAGEQGLLFKLERDSGRFAALTLPYAGTLFGLIGKDRVVVAHGLRGNVVRSADAGRTWQSVPTGVGVGLTASALDERGRMVIVSQAGHVLVSSDLGASFAPLKLERPTPASAVVSAGPGALVVAGPRGAQILPLA